MSKKTSKAIKPNAAHFARGGQQNPAPMFAPGVAPEQRGDCTDCDYDHDHDH